MWRYRFLGLLLLWTVPTPSQALIGVELIASALAEPVFATAPAGDDRIFILERDGLIRILENGSVLTEPFLNLSGQVGTLNTGGLLGLAFPPDYSSSGLFYVYYTRTDGQLILSRFQVSAFPNLADDTNEDVLLTVANPDLKHNGGTIAFSPSDGYLYLAFGDGGGEYDPNEIAQNTLELRGKVLRVDVSGGFNVPLSIPTTNPFVDDPSTLNEIWAIGFRNPYRWSFDRVTGDLWIGDVGEIDREEINFQPADSVGGLNFGWDIMEGTACNLTDPSPAYPCNDPALTLPVHDYDQSQGDCSVIGGYVYRGVGAEYGRYFFGDFCTARVWSMDPDTLVVTDRTLELAQSLPVGISIERIASFGEDGAGEVLIVDSMGGNVFRLDQSPTAVPSLAWPAHVSLCIIIAATVIARGRPRGPMARL